jgi:hypothetical protein
MMNLDDMFSVFISLIAMGVEEGGFFRGMLATVERVGDRAGFRVGPSRTAARQDGVVSWAERIVFDIQTENVLLRDCDIVTYRSNALGIVNIGMPQHTLVLEQVRDCARKEGLIWNLVSAFFGISQIVAAKVAVEDSFSLEALDVFRPGDWNVFRKGRIPDFLSAVRPQVTSEGASFYTSEQICALKIGQEEMGLSLVRALGLRE